MSELLREGGITAVIHVATVSSLAETPKSRF
jgi:hypothetical protein